MILELLAAVLLAAGPRDASAQQPAPTAANATAASPASLEGTWRGRVTDETGEQSIVLHITTRKGQVDASLDSPERRSLGLIVTHFRRDGQHVSFSLPASQAAYEGELSTDGSTISGLWTRNRRTAETDFVRDGAR